MYKSAFYGIYCREVIALKRGFVTFLLCAVAAAAFFSAVSAGKKNEEVIVDYSYVLVESETGAVLAENNGRQPRSAGYLNKLMTLLLIAEDIETGKFRLTDELTASESVLGTKGSVVWLQPGDKMTVEELLKSVIIGNANDAVTVLAEASEQTLDKFVMRMNTRAFDLGLRCTSFYSPYGYDNEQEITTAADMAVICSELSKYEQLTPYFKMWRDFVKDGTVELVSENQLTRTYPQHIGFKASHSELSGYCAAECGKSENGTKYISVVLGAPDAETAQNKAKELCRKGFSEYKVTGTMFPDEMLLPIKVRNGRDIAVPIRLRSQSSVVVPRVAGDLRTVTVLPKFVTAPVKNGQVIGTAAFFNGKTLVYESDIITDGSVSPLDYSYIFREMLLNIVE